MITDCSAMTKTVHPSKCTTEFTLHVARSYDYRFVTDAQVNFFTKFTFINSRI